MDVFKLLSRSSRTPLNSSSQTLPSAGAVANPQLFGHGGEDKGTNGLNKGKKRKRGSQPGAEDVEEDGVLPGELDFFGKGEENGQEKGHPKKRKGEMSTESGDKNRTLAELVEEADYEPYDEDKCKRILRAHKLKVAILEDFAAFAAPDLDERGLSKKRNKKKRDKTEKIVKDKKANGKTQLYPRPLTEFAQLRTRYKISRRLAENIREQGYALPTEVQIGALPLTLRRRNDVDEMGDLYNGDIDLLTIAPTGSGKTIAFLIPAINALLSKSKSATLDGPQVLILAPTRELAAQIVNEARKLAKGTGIRATLMRKGMEVVKRTQEDDNGGASDTSELSAEDEDDESDVGSEKEQNAVQQRKKNKRQAELVKAAIVVATPLALLNALKRRDGSVAELPSIMQLIFDEADVLLDPLFRDQTLSVWNACTNLELRVGLWSATMGSSIESLTISTLNSRWETLSSKNDELPPRPPLLRLVVGLKDTAIPNITHQLTYAATEQGKLLGLRQLLHPTTSISGTPTLRPPFLVFTQTIPRATALHSELLYDIPPEAGGSSRIAVLHANLSSSVRDAIMTRFRRGEIWILITTDLLARGVDFRGLNGVVNYDVPTSTAGYVHRVGRTGRAGRQGGVAVTFYTSEDIPHVRLIANVIRAAEKVRGVGSEESSVKQWLLDALPAPSKREKQVLKRRGVEVRRVGKEGKEGRRSRISTKSGVERRRENNRRGAVEAARRRKEGGEEQADGDGSEGFDGFSDEE